MAISLTALILLDYSKPDQTGWTINVNGDYGEGALLQNLIKRELKFGERSRFQSVTWQETPTNWQFWSQMGTFWSLMSTSWSPHCWLFKTLTTPIALKQIKFVWQGELGEVV